LIGSLLWLWHAPAVKVMLGKASFMVPDLFSFLIYPGRSGEKGLAMVWG